MPRWFILGLLQYILTIVKREFRFLIFCIFHRPCRRIWKHSDPIHVQGVTINHIISIFLPSLTWFGPSPYFKIQKKIKHVNFQFITPSPNNNDRQQHFHTCQVFWFSRNSSDFWFEKCQKIGMFRFPRFSVRKKKICQEKVNENKMKLRLGPRLAKMMASFPLNALFKWWCCSLRIAVHGVRWPLEMT